MKPDRVVFNALITACGQSGAVDRAFDVLSEMKAEARPIEPDQITIGALMKACANSGQVYVHSVFRCLYFKSISSLNEIGVPTFSYYYIIINH